MDIAQVLVIVVLVLAALVAAGLVVLIAIAVSTVLEVFALAKTVHAEVKGVGATLKVAGERLAGSGAGLLGLLGAFGSKKRSKGKADREA